ncbi:MAG TPA: MBL fold metallo-hydrolase [Leptospiraceae bacterium]|nr:MBL fold metallo-hydrolase [Leptospiraceae bacterium]HMW04206.1 MBL fold metallo-hydrolase [Leptospiraceae bacterium]HMX32738.1 MBL fold metallo-hydrolase [Leptospiraceae bacterium]HMY30199.1 MBL fold metallo-hydrolase [Leptospiraceae bacterium]HNA06552.1 MBL fold metallo-hydrolase [Leptospiraceae bacterium]
MIKIFLRLFLLFSLPILANNEIKGIYALVYGKSTYPSELLNVKDETKTKTILWLFYLIQVDRRIILVDTGFTEKKYVSSFQISDFKHPTLLIRNLNLTPEQVTDIILTHSHFDHIGGAHYFPNAKIYINTKELEVFQSSDGFKQFEKVFEVRNFRNQIQKIDSNFYLTPEISIYFSGGHTIGSQYVHLKTENKEFVITGDECYLAKECLEGIGLSAKAAYNLSNNKIFIDKLSELRKKNTRLEVLTLHDFELVRTTGIPKNGIITIYEKK